MDKLDEKRIDRLYELLHEKEKSDPDAAASLRWAIFTLEQEKRQTQNSGEPIFQFALKPESEINDIMDTGVFNEIIKGYLVTAMMATGAGREEIQRAVDELEDAFEDTDAEAARKAYREF